MNDPRYEKLSDLLVKYSLALKKGERVLLEMFDVPDEFTIYINAVDNADPIAISALSFTVHTL